MDLAGLLSKILLAVENINLGRKGLSTDGQEHQGRLDYEDGLSFAADAFSEAQTASDPKTIMLAEEAFVEQELQYCSETDAYTKSSLQAALQSFDDAFLSLEAVEDPSGYKAADKTWPHTSKYRTHDCPRDAYHLACISHRTRLKNSLRTPGINMKEKAILEQRIANMGAAQTAYLEKQTAALAGTKKENR